MKREGEVDGRGSDADADFEEYNEVDTDGDTDGDGFEFEPDGEGSDALRSDLHVIYRRKNAQMEHSSDYRE